MAGMDDDQNQIELKLVRIELTWHSSPFHVPPESGNMNWDADLLDEPRRKP